jgi:pyruvate dehydrogenase (quinone)
MTCRRWTLSSRRRKKHGAILTRIGYDAPEVTPAQKDLERAARVLNEGKKVAMLVGAEARHATDEVIEAADKLRAGVAKALLGKAALPDDLPFVTGSSPIPTARYWLSSAMARCR